MIKYIKDFFVATPEEKDFTFNTAKTTKTSSKAKVVGHLTSLSLLLSLGSAGITVCKADTVDSPNNTVTSSQQVADNSSNTASSGVSNNYSFNNNQDSKGTLKVGYVNSSNYLIIDNYAKIGLDYQLLSEFARDNGYSIEFEKYDSLNDLYKDLGDKKLDLAAGHLSVNSKFFNKDKNLIPVDYFSEELVLVSDKQKIARLQSQASNASLGDTVYVPHNYELVNKGALSKYFDLEDHGASAYKLLQEVNDDDIQYALVPLNVAKAMKQLLSNIDYVSLDDVKFKPLAQTNTRVINAPTPAQAKEIALAKQIDKSEGNNSATANLDTVDSSTMVTLKPTMPQRKLADQHFDLDERLISNLTISNDKPSSLDNAKSNVNLFYVAGGKKQLASDLNNYIKQIQSTKEFDSMAYSSFKNLDEIRPSEAKAFTQSVKSKFAQYAPVFKKYSTDVDYRLAMAVGYQESKWNPSAKTKSGPSGMMMLTNATAKSLNVTNKLDPIQSISAGVKLLTSYWKQQPKQITGKDRLMYALAQYNQGIAKVLDARNWLKRNGLQTDSYAVLAKNYDAIGKAGGHKYGKINGKAAVNYLHEVDRWYSMLINYRYFIQK